MIDVCILIIIITTFWAQIEWRNERQRAFCFGKFATASATTKDRCYMWMNVEREIPNRNQKSNKFVRRRNEDVERKSRVGQLVVIVHLRNSFIRNQSRSSVRISHAKPNSIESGADWKWKMDQCRHTFERIVFVPNHFSPSFRFSDNLNILIWGLISFFTLVVAIQFFFVIRRDHLSHLRSKSNSLTVKRTTTNIVFAFTWAQVFR